MVTTIIHIKRRREKNIKCKNTKNKEKNEKGAPFLKEERSSFL